MDRSAEHQRNLRSDGHLQCGRAGKRPSNIGYVRCWRRQLFADRRGLWSRLEWVLRKNGIYNLVVAGIVTNGGVALTVRGAHALDLHTTVLSNGCAAFSDTAHNSAITDLSNVSDVATCAQVTALLDG